jgi:polar amino acid transport system substrate-binding protein
MKIILPLLVGAVVGLIGPAQARSLDTIRSIGALGLCAHPNSLPFASKAGDPPGFQVELGKALARELGVSLQLDWIITTYQIRSDDCDIMMDVIADREAQGETNLRITKPYYRTGVALAVPMASPLASFASLDQNTKVGVQVGSVAAMVISQRHVPISIFGFELDSL